MKNSLVFIISIIFISCSGKKTVDKPEKLIEKEQMENILYDLALLQAVKSYFPQKLTTNGINHKTYIYKKYNIDSLQFVENNRYYTSDPEEYKKMFDNVLERIKNQKSEIDTLLIQEKKKINPLKKSQKSDL